jgi:nucleotide-binding universal stress UspA family protein
MDLSTILVPTDFSSTAENALAYAADLAERTGAALHVLHVINQQNPEWYDLADPLDMVDDLRRQLRNQAQYKLANLDAETEVETKITIEISFDVASSLHDYIDSRDVDLLVIGAHGRTGVREMVLGSLTEKMLRHAACPVLAVGQHVPWEDTRRELEVVSMLAPVDFSDSSKYALRMAKSFADLYKTQLDVLFVAEERVVPQFHDTGLPTMGVVRMDPDIVARAEPAIEQLAADVGGPDVPITPRVREGRAAQAITDFATERDSDFIVLATRGLSGLQRIFVGSVTERVVRATPCPVLVVRAPHAEEEG